MISLEEFVERLCLLGAAPRPRPLPRRRQDREILMKSIRMCIDPDRTYDEAQINALLQAWNRDVAPALETDHVTIRRMLVDHGQLERTPDGARYRLGFPARPPVFDLQVESLDLRATIAAYRERARKPRPRP
jgi:hypothetical protein